MSSAISLFFIFWVCFAKVTCGFIHQTQRKKSSSCKIEMKLLKLTVAGLKENLMWTKSTFFPDNSIYNYLFNLNFYNLLKYLNIDGSSLGDSRLSDVSASRFSLISSSVTRSRKSLLFSSSPSPPPAF